jgi:hypothetical protein
MIGSGFFQDDLSDAQGVQLLADLTGRFDDIWEEDPADSEGVRMRADAMPDPHFPAENDVQDDGHGGVLYGYDFEFKGTLAE